MIFSKRHKDSLKKKTLVVGIDRNTRTRLYRCLLKHDYTISTTSETGWHDDQSAVYSVLKDKLLDEQGWKQLLIWDGAEKRVKNIDDFIYFGRPAHVLDALEIFYSMAVEYDENALTYQQDVNKIFTEEKYPWRMLNGKLFKVDSAYLDEEILTETHSLLHSHANEFEGALDEFEQARNHFENGRHRDALTYANHAFESTLKTILGPKYANKKTGELIKAIQNSKYIPSYLHNVKDFQNLLEAPPTIRSNSGGHGSGEEKLIVPPEFAELMMHLSGSLIHFLIKTHIAKSGIKADEKKEAAEKKEPDEYVDMEPF